MKKRKNVINGLKSQHQKDIESLKNQMQEASEEKVRLAREQSQLKIDQVVTNAKIENDKLSQLLQTEMELRERSIHALKAAKAQVEAKRVTRAVIARSQVLLFMIMKQLVQVEVVPSMLQALVVLIV